jgi:hypothetical protein
LAGLCRDRAPLGQACSDAVDGIKCEDGISCVHGVCCSSTSCKTCERCDLPGHEGTCTNEDGIDKSNDCPGDHNSICFGVCNGQGTCIYPQSGMSCGICKECDLKGTCGGVPDEDPRCAEIDCVVGECEERVQDAAASGVTASVRHCSALGICALSDDPTVCAVTPKVDDTACADGAGVCSGGRCILALPHSRSTGCAFSR